MNYTVHVKEVLQGWNCDGFRGGGVDHAR